MFLECRFGQGSKPSSPPVGLLELIFPKVCVGCGSWGSYFCARCQKNILQSELVCPICERAAIGGATHPLCRKRYGLDGLWSLGIYQDPLKRGIQQLKYRLVTDLASILVDLLIEYWARYSAHLLDEIKKDPNSWVVVPVPLHPRRQRWRGFNQAALLGKLLASKIGLQFSEALTRVKNTKPQVGLKGKARYQNIKNAFSIIENWKLKIENSNILLVDDVWTTGSTLKECAYVLKRGGAGKIWAITLAR